MIDHIGLIVSDFEKSKLFYTESLSAIGYMLLMEFPASATRDTDVVGFGEPPRPDFWISRGTQRPPAIHVSAFNFFSRKLKIPCMYNRENIIFQ